MSEEKSIQDDELEAAFFKIKHSDNEIEATEAAKYILNSHMDINGIRSILTTYQTSINNSKNSSEQGYATDIAQKSFSVVVAQLFVNSYRMGMLDQQNEYKKMVQEIQDSKGQEIIGVEASENTSEG